MFEKLVIQLQVEGGETMDYRRRSITKALTWRIIALIITIMISYAFLGNWSTSIIIGLVSNFVKTLGYYVHERLWERTNWGRK